MRRTRNCFTLHEMLIVLVIIGAMTALAMPRVKNGMTRESIRSARRAVVGQLSRARGAAAARGCPAVFHVVQGASPRIWVTSCPVSGAGVDTVGSVDNLVDRYGVMLASTGDSITFVPTGISLSSSWISMRFSKASSSDTLGISPLGKAVW